MGFLKGTVAAATLALGLAVAPQANASLILQVNGNTVDTAALNTVVAFSGAVGNFEVNRITGVGSALLSGSGTLFDLGSLDVNSTGSGTLTIRFTETNLNFYGMLSGIFTGTLANMTVARSVYYDATNSGLTTTLLGTTTAGGGTFGGATGTTPYSLTETITLTANGSGAFLSTDDSVRVPEPMSIALLGGGLLGVGMLRRRKA